MSLPVLFSPAASTDVLDIWNYTAAKWGENQAELYINELSSACYKISDGLNEGTIVDYIRTGYRKVLVNKHAIYFTRNEKEISVIRILHQSMDVSVM